MREYIDVVPSNGSGTASYKDGNPIIHFIIGAQDRFLRLFLSEKSVPE